MADSPDTIVPPGSRALPVGTRVAQFELVGVIAETALGIEYQAIDRADDTEVVLREYLPQRLALRVGTAVRPRSPREAGALAKGLKAFAEEAQALTRIEHPSLARVVGVVEANDTAYLATLPSEGSSLRELRLARREPPTEPVLRGVLDALLGALESLHRGGIVHGAVSPEHVRLLDDGLPLLLASDPAEFDAGGGMAASPFAAPELRDAPSTARVGPWTDLYSLAQTMRFWIGGEWPTGATAAPSPHESVTEMARRLFISARYTPQLLDALESALATEPAARPESVAQLRRALGTRPAVVPFPTRPFVVAPPPPSPPPSPAPAADPAGRIEPPFDPAPRGAALREERRPRRKGGRAWWVAAVALLLLALAYAAWQFAPRMAVRGREAVPAPAVPPPQPVTPTPEVVAPAPAPAPIAEPAPAPAPASTPVPSPPAAPAPAPAPAPSPAPAPAVKAAPAPTGSPRDACAGRTQFALYRCMQAQCAQRAWAKHPQCDRLRATDSVE